jgi:hypothetical protein
MKPRNIFAVTLTLIFALTLLALCASTAKSSKLAEFYTAESARNSKILVDLNRGDFDTLVTKGGRHIIS